MYSSAGRVMMLVRSDHTGDGRNDAWRDEDAEVAESKLIELEERAPPKKNSTSLALRAIAPSGEVVVVVAIERRLSGCYQMMLPHALVWPACVGRGGCGHY